MFKKVCIIGAGISGLSTLHHLKKLENQDGESLDITVYDRNPDVGGLWQYTDYDEQIGGPGVLYKGLR